MVRLRLSNKNNLSWTRIKRSHPIGLSLVELIIVLGISSLLVAGSFAWFSSNRGTEFYDQSRQILSAVQEAQTEIASNYMPGQVDSCAKESRVGPPGPDCPINKNQQILATSVGINTVAPNDKSINIGYYSVDLDSDTHSVASDPGNVHQYGGRTVNLPASIKAANFKIYNFGAGGACGVFNGVVTTDNSPARISGTSIVTFRRDPSVMNHFISSFSTSYYDNSTGWGGNDPYDTINNAHNPVNSIPCAIGWLFESEERMPGNPALPRFNSQIVFDIRSKTVKLQTNQ